MKNYDEFYNDLKTLISFNTEKTQATLDAPFGVENKRALDFFLSVAERMGFKTINYDNYVGEIVFGDGEKEFGLIGHLDIVPAGTDWDTEPFTLTEKDGFLFGRGVIDDKMPSLLTLYALKELKDSGIKPNCKFRFFVGTNEESGWKDVEYLKTKTTLPEYGFSPDGIFPLSYAEKGMYEVRFLMPTLKNFHSLCGGTAINAVCAHATVIADTKIDDALLNKYNVSMKDGKITAVGIAAHGSSPQLGKNAFKPLFELMTDAGEDLGHFVDYLFNDKGGVFALKNEQGNITLSPNIIKEIEGKTYLSADVRIPAPFDASTLIPVLDTFGIEYLIIESQPPVVVEKDGEFVNALLSAYRTVTGDIITKPRSMGGSTFARAFSKGCSFGPEFPKINYRIHNSNENVSLEELQKMYDIYKTALINLSKLS